MTKEEKEIWDRARERKLDCDREIAENEKLLRDNPDHEHREMLLDDIEHARKVRDIISKAIPD